MFLANTPTYKNEFSAHTYPCINDPLYLPFSDISVEFKQIDF